ncbi:DUF6069 family protein [Nonomuraea sp. NPDC049695]|uniref:DUF6069 family protein n=1 Tax=Nonomuraea sp. NPDC049695 TaxID=3154734 RepID=UPI00343F7549
MLTAVLDHIIAPGEALHHFISNRYNITSSAEEIMTTLSKTPQSVTPNTSTRRARALGVGAAVLSTTLLWLAALAVNIDLRVDPPGDGQPAMIVGLPVTIGSTLVLALIGWGTLAVLERFVRRAGTIWTGLAIAALMLSFVPILSVEATAGTKTVLSLMHLAVAAILIPTLRRGTPTTRNALT